MVVSRCHKAPVWVYCGNEGTSFYVCCHCDRACDTMDGSLLHGELTDEPRIKTEAERVTNAG